MSLPSSGKIAARIALLALALLILTPGLESCKYQKMKSHRVSIELKTPSGSGSRGLGDLHIAEDRVAVTRNNNQYCTAKVSDRLYTRLINRLNRVGFIFLDSGKDALPRGLQPSSLKVSEFRQDETRSNTVYWTGQNFPDADLILLLRQVRHEITEEGNCRGNLSGGAPCNRHEQCRSGCCMNGEHKCGLKEQCRSKATH